MDSKPRRIFAERIKLEEDEVVLALVRKHWFVITMQLLGVGIAAFIPPILYGGTQLLIPSLGALMSINPDMSALTTLYGSEVLAYGYALWLLIIWMALFNIWTNYYLDVWTITNKRLIAVDQRGLFTRYTGSFRLERLQDINVTVSGILGTLLKFGNLYTETASGDRVFTARNIPNPQEVKALILEAADKITFTNDKRPADSSGV